MTRPRTLFALTLGATLLLGATAFQTAWAKESARTTELDADVARKVDAALGTTRPGDDVAAIVAATLRAQGDDEPLLERLVAVYDDENAAPARRNAARWIAADTLHRRGDLKLALELVEVLHAEASTPELALRRAELLDATGKRDAAIAAYEQIIADEPSDGLSTRLHLRLALLDEEKRRGAPSRSSRRSTGMVMIRMGGGAHTPESKGREKPPTEAADALIEFMARSIDPALRRRAAILLGALGYPASAGRLYETSTQSSDFHDVVRRAEWAIAAEDTEGAKTWSWAALDAAGLRRDRRFALGLLVESYRKSDALDDLIERLAALPDPDDDTRNLWIDLLRETGRVDDALAAFRDANGAELSIVMRREILEMQRQTGDDDKLIAGYREQIAAEPQRVEWREGLARYFLEQGDEDAARAVWTTGPAPPETSAFRLAAAESLTGLGLDDLAQDAAERCVSAQDGAEQALLLLSRMHASRGRFEEAAEALDRLDALAAPGSAVRMALAEALEKLGRNDRAAEVLIAVLAARGTEGGAEDVEMHLAWLQGELGEDDDALLRWRDLWERVEAVSRRRYIEERLMTIAARLGKLADIVVDLEDRLSSGSAERRDSGLLVRIYTNVGDAVSATEIIDEYMQRTGGDPIKTLVEKSYVYLACTDYAHYEETLDALIELDPENEPDYLQQLAMSKLERGRHDEARKVLKRLQATGAPEGGLEFEAGVLAIAGLRDEAAVAYRRGLAGRPENIDSYLLLANVMKGLGQTQRAIGMFQYLAQHAAKDDLFTIAIDGLLNMEANPATMKWARRTVYERIAMHAEKIYLHRLCADLSEELGDVEGMLQAIESALPLAGQQRVPFLRELMDTSAQFGMRAESLRFGRRLIASGELVPPQVYLDLGEALLADGDVVAAEKTFSRASDVPDQAAFRLKVAASFEKAGFLNEALRAYQGVLVGRTTDAGLLVKTGELLEQLGRDEQAARIHRRALDGLFQRRPFSVAKGDKEEKKDKSPWAWYRARNVGEFDEHYTRALRGWLATATPESARAALESDATALRADLQRLESNAKDDEDSDAAESAAENTTKGDAEDGDTETKGIAKNRRLSAYPRIRDRAAFVRRVALAFREPDRADATDLALVSAFPGDEQLLEDLVRGRLTWGRRASAIALLDGSGRPADEIRNLRWLVGDNSGAAPGTIPLAEAARRVLPLLRDGKRDELRDLLARADMTRSDADALAAVPALLWAALELEDADLTLLVGRRWLRLAADNAHPYEIERQADLVIGRCAAVLSPSELRSLAMSLVGIVRDEPEKYVGLLAFLPKLQVRFEQPLLTSEQALELVAVMAEKRSWGMGELLRIIPPEETLEAIRTAVEKAPESRRAMILPQLLGGLERPAGKELTSYAIRTFEEGLAGVQDEWWLRSLLSNTPVRDPANLELFVKLSGVLLEKHPTIVQAAAARVTYLLAVGREDDALALGLDRFREYLVRADSDWMWTQAARQIQDTLLPAHNDAFLRVFDEVAARDGPSAGLAMKRLDFLARDASPLAQAEAAREAAERFPEDDQLRERYVRALRTLGRRRTMVTVLEAAAGKKPKDTGLLERIASEWINLRHAPNAIAARKRIAAIETAARAKASSGASGERFLPANAKTLQDAVEKDDVPLAQTTLRRMWRLFDMDPRFAAMWSGQRIDSMWWPFTRPETDGPPPRGGLDGFLARTEAAPVERQTVFEALADRDFALDEMRRVLRTMEPAQLRNVRNLHTAVAAAEAARHGVDDAVARAVRRIEDGSGDARDEMLLLALLERNPEIVDESLRGTLETLTSATAPLDGKAILQLARVHAKAGEPDKAARLYRWCAYLSSAAGVWGTGNLTSLDARSLVNDAMKDLDGQRLADFVDTLAVCADPGASHWGRDGFETLMLETWEQASGAALAVERGARIIENVTDTKHAVKRNTAKVAAALLARVGRDAEALRCLEFAVTRARLTPDLLLLSAWERMRRTQGGYLSYVDVARLFSPIVTEDEDTAEGSSDDDKWTPDDAWLAAAADALTAWVGEDRVDARQAFVPLAVLALRLHERGDTARSARLRGVVLELAADDAGRRLWAADLARLTGDTAGANALEDSLLAEGSLHVERVAEVLRRVGESKGNETELRRGELTWAWTAHPDVLAELGEIARETGDEDASSSWEARAAEEQAAQQALDAEDAKTD